MVARKKAPKAYSYLRFSTPEQMKGDSHRRQWQMAEQYAAVHGLDLDTELTYKDLGVSAFKGRNAEVGELRAFLNAVENEDIPTGSYLLVENLDRISRQSARKASRILEEIIEAGIVLVTLNDGKEWTLEAIDGFDWIMASVLLFRGNEESRTKQRRLKSVWEKKRATGNERKLTARVPAWLTMDCDHDKGKPHTDTCKFRVIPERAKIVKRIFAETLKGTGQEAIARMLNNEGVATFGGGSGKGKFWYRSYIAKIQANPAVIGTYIPHTSTDQHGKRKREAQKPIQGYYPSVISNEIFRRVQAMREVVGSSQRGRHASRETRNIFGGLMRCAECGGSMTLVQKGKKSLPKFVCSKAKNGAGCRYQVSAPYAQIEDAVIRNAAWLFSMVPAGNKDTGLDTELENVRAAIGATQDSVENLLFAIKRNGGTAALTRELQHAEADLADLAAKERKLSERQFATMGKLVSNRVDDLERALSHHPLDRKEVNVFMRQVFSGVVLDNESGIVVFEWKQGGETPLTVAWPKEYAPKSANGNVRRSA